MQYLERIDATDRTDGTPAPPRLRQVGPDTGRLLAILAASAPTDDAIEVGTSAGYSTMWLSLGCHITGARLTTFEILPRKIALARETLDLCHLEDSVRLVADDAREHLASFPAIAFCFLDAEKAIYGECYEEIVPRLVPGGLLVADNATSHESALRSMLTHVEKDERVDAMIVPIGNGLLLCRKN